MLFWSYAGFLVCSLSRNASGGRFGFKFVETLFALTLKFFMRAQNLLKYWVPALAWMLLMFVGSTDMLSAEHTSRFLVPFLHWLNPHISMATIVSIHFALRKIAHFMEYAVLAGLLWRGLRGTFSAASKMLLAFSTFLVAATFAASDEYHQSFVPSRTASAHDVMIDCVGAFVAVLLCLMFARARARNAEARI
jgi:VanZ family protein